MIEFPYFNMQQLNLDWIIDKIKGILSFLPDDGTAGQILRRTADGAEWSDEETGGDAVESVNGKTGAVVLDKTDIGLGNVANVAQYSASNPPPYPVTSVNGQTGAVTVQTATDAQVTTAVNTWLGENVAQETGYVLDSTLTMSNAAPPASAVGDLKSSVDVHYLLTEEGAASFAPPSAQYTNAPLSTSTGQIGAANTTRATGPYVEIPLNSNATWGVGSGYAFTAVCQYDEDKNYLGQFVGLTAETRYMRFCIKRNDNGNITTSEAASAFSISYTYNGGYVKKVIGKKFLLFGDSIMHGSGNSNYGVGDILAEKFQMPFWDYCQSGALVEYMVGQTATPVYEQIQNAISANITPDFIIMDGLSNDIAHGTRGTMSADFDYAAHGYNDFSSALEYCFGLLKDNYPTIPVLYVIPHSSAARVYATELSFGNRAREICQKWSIPIADVYRDGNMNGRIEEQMKLFTPYPDETTGTHPNRAGYDFAYMPLIENWLMNIFARIE